MAVYQERKTWSAHPTVALGCCSRLFVGLEQAPRAELLNKEGTVLASQSASLLVLESLVRRVGILLGSDK